MNVFLRTLLLGVLDDARLTLIRSSANSPL